MTNKELVQRAISIAENHKTIYLWGTFGAPLTENLIRQKAKQYPRNYSAGRRAYLRTQISARPTAFDCVGLIKGILWGWNGAEDKSFGGAVYQSNGVPDINAGTMAKRTMEQSTDFEQLVLGEVVFKNGHIGIYAGEGKVVEATLEGDKDGVVISPLFEGAWTGHGKLPWVDYTDLPLQEEEEAPQEILPPDVGDTVYFSGNRHYTSSSSDRSYSARPGPARVTNRAEGRKHPYHIIHTDKTSNVYGWVDEDTVTLL
ncbi:MAG: hypothetical protein IJC19_03290 [Clostridia bacterium]|nr:hypothetical protein [Clostridia bacterium]